MNTVSAPAAEGTALSAGVAEPNGAVETPAPMERCANCDAPLLAAITLYAMFTA